MKGAAAMMGIGPTEFMLVIVVFALLFGPGAVLVWWLMTHANATDVAGGDASGTVDVADPALEAARERYARGEINRDEFEEIKSTLGH